MLRQGRSQARVLSLITAAVALAALTGCNRDPNVRKQKYLESGQRYEKNGKMREAAIQFSNALKIDHNFGQAHFELGKVYMQMGAMQAAANEFFKAVDLMPNDIQSRLNLATLELAGGRPDDAMVQIKAIQKMQPNNADAFALLAGVNASKGDREAAQQNMEHALAIDPNRATFHTSLAMMEAQESAANAEQELRKAIALDPKYVVSHMALSSLLEKKGDAAGAEQEALAATHVAPTNLQAREGLVGLYMRQGNTGKAEQVIRQTSEDFADNPRGAAMLSSYYVQQGRPDLAAQAYASLVQAHPKSFYLNFEYGRVLVILHKDAEAQKVSALLNKMNPNSPETAVLDASLQLDEGKVNDAFDTLQKAVKNFPENAPLRLAAGRVSLYKGDVSAADANYHEAARIEPRNVNALMGLAEVADRRGDSTLLEQAATTALSIDPNFVPAYVWRATAEANQKQYDKAEADLQIVIKGAPTNSGAYIELGQLRMVQNKLGEATQLLEKGLTLDPDSDKALHELVLIDLNNKQPEKAMARVQAQIAKVPNNPRMLTELAALQLRTGDFANARANSQKAMQMDSEDSTAAQINANAEVALGNTNGAINVWQQWSAKHPTDARATSMIGEMYDAQGNYQQAQTYYQKSLQLDPSQAWAANNLAYLMVQHGQNLDVALSLAQQARTAMPNSADTADTLAWVYYNKGMFGSSRDLLEDALKSDPNNAAIHYHLGLAYTRLGDKADASNHLKKAVSLAPNDQVGKDAAAALAKVS